MTEELTTQQEDLVLSTEKDEAPEDRREFNLSEKLKEGGILYDNDVKEFIKRLKESFIDDNSWHESIYPGLFEKIDKLAGKELI